MREVADPSVSSSHGANSLKYAFLIGGVVGALAFGFEAGDGRPFMAFIPGLLWFTSVTLGLLLLQALTMMVARVCRNALAKRRGRT